jgi:hypothetical protein
MSEGKDYSTYCISCGSGDVPLMMIAHRNRKERMVGFLFCCADCETMVENGQLNFTITITEEEGSSPTLRVVT